METTDDLGASTSSMWTRLTIANARLAVEIFDGTSHFGMWQSEGLDIAIDEKKPDDVQEKDWKAINRLKNSQNKFHLKKKLFRFTYVPGTTMNDHITKFNQLVTNLLNMDETFKDEDLALMLLGSLPEEFEFIETTLLHGKSDISLSESMAGHTLKEKLRRGDQSQSPNLGKMNVPFFYEKDHWKKNCPKLKNKGKAIVDACVAKHDTSDSELSLVASSSSFHLDEWILDSGCTYHMSPNREWFFNLVELNGGVIYMGNDNACKTVGIGSIQLKNQDGSIRVLTDVLHVPNLKKNLILLGALESKNSVVTTRDGALKVTSGALLWHMKLGHASEKSLKILAKRVWLYTMRTKDEVLGVFLKWKTMIENQTGKKIKQLRTGNGGEYKIRDTPQQNGVAERMNRTLLEKVQSYALPIVDNDFPVTYQEAMQSLESDKWKSAMDEEMQSLQKNNTWELKDVRYKARLVAKGYTQKEGIDYNDAFFLVVKHFSIRILLALVAQLNLELAQLDVKTAFLHGELEEEIYMTQLEGYKDAGGRNWVCKLKKSLYGLKQSSRQWYKRFDSFMRRQKYTRSKYDNCVYLQKLHDRSFIYLLLYVDDMLIASKSQKEIDKLKAQLNEEFEMKDLDEAKKILGMEISRDRQRGKLCLNQKQYLKKVLQCFGVNENTKHVSTPLVSHLKLSTQLSPKIEEEKEYMAKVPYANAVGNLMYAMNEALGQFVVGYVNFDFAGDLDKRRSTTGYLFTLAKAPVSWKSTLQSTVAMSTTETEYMAVTEAVMEAIWLNGLLEDLRVVQSHISLYCDSQSAIHLAKNQKIPTVDNPADMMTKSAFGGTTKDSFIEFGELKEVCEDVIILIKSSRWRLLTIAW
ncbi:hypothetical protein CXB51_029115 [Gossypium anomalum]|uniref:Reverse transcriptase Ty1/copia-type domain-containing protein n=1 Tax=Gossypium anomalum TaxID=47600 RepID=A0A8J6CQC1_9ROSI|nr:hypothetical protein CXB51_029115 [Gossypium anomalum]